MSQDAGTCAVCRASAVQKCSGCQTTYYCSREHQKQHWKFHKLDCKPIKIESDSLLGRYLIATRDIKWGSVICTEKSLISGPSQITPPVCLGCYELLKKEKAIECKICGWPVCSEACEKSTNHRPECEWTARRGEKVHIRGDYGMPNPNYQCITVLRCLYQKTANPEVWKRIDALESHCAERKLSPKWEHDRIHVAEFMRKFYKIENDFSEDEIMRVLGIVQINGHEIPLSEYPHVAVYDKISMIEHSCKANCAKSFTSSGEVVLIAAMNIAKGGHISICYTDPMWGTDTRRHHLIETKYFNCLCDRCQDPAEMKTMFDAVKCRTKECVGYLLPKSFLKDETNPDDKNNSIKNCAQKKNVEERERRWYCNKCDGDVNDTVIQSMLEHIGRDLTAVDRGSSENCERFINHCSKYLHPSHYYMVEIGVALAQIIGQENEQGLTAVSEDKLKLKSELCTRIANIIEKLFPAEFRIRGTLLFELHAAIAERGRRSSLVNGPDVLIPYLIESKKVLEEAVNLLKHEPPELPEGKIGHQAARNLKDIHSLLKKITASVGDSPM